jgi:hypothetical protein
VLITKPIAWAKRFGGPATSFGSPSRGAATFVAKRPSGLKRGPLAERVAERDDHGEPVGAGDQRDRREHDDAAGDHARGLLVHRVGEVEHPLSRVRRICRHFPFAWAGVGGAVDEVRTMKKRLAVLSLAAVAAVPAAPPAASAQTAREFEGTVVSVNRDARTFRLRDEGRTVTIRVTSRTRYERLSGFGAIRRGASDIEAIARRSNGRWVATLVERSGRSGGGDDRRGRGSDDGPGDDRGGRGRGSDDR